MKNTFDWVEIRTRDTEKSAKFYENLFGWKIIERLTADGSDYWIFDTGGVPRIHTLQKGGIWLRSKGESPGIVIHILVSDIDSILNKVMKLGGKIATPKTQQGPAFRACFTDPDGNLFGLWEERVDE